MNLTIEEVYLGTSRVFRVVGNVTVAQLEAVQGVKRASFLGEGKTIVQVRFDDDPEEVKQRILEL